MMNTPLQLSICDQIDKIVGFHDATRHATLRNSAMLGPSHPDTKARCTGDDEYAPTNLGPVGAAGIYLSIYLSI